MITAEYNNPWAWDKERYHHNPLANFSPMLNPSCISWSYQLCRNNPEGDRPILNPEEYINPLSGRYSGGPFEF